MSYRTLFEINHDYSHELEIDVVPFLKDYLRSTSRESAERLERFGIHVVGMRHHADNYILKDTAEGFPPTYLKETKP